MQEENFAELSDERFRDGVSPRSHSCAVVLVVAETEKSPVQLNERFELSSKTCETSERLQENCHSLRSNT